MKGVQVAHHTVDHPLQIDGKYDEIYVAAQVSKFNLRTAELLQHGTGRSRVHGDIGDGTPFPTRVKAGTASPQGGLRGDYTAMPPVADVIPPGLNPGGPPAQALTDQIPFVAWEGTLTSGEDVLVIAPSIWEWDGDDTPFKQYTEIGKVAAVPMYGLMTVPEIAATPSIEVTQTVIPNTTTGTLWFELPSTEETQIMLATAGIYTLAKTFLGSGPDRLIGVDGAVSVGSAGSGVIYRDRFIVLTRDKIERALTSRPAVPSALPLSVIAIEYFDTALAFDLKGKYVLYL